MKVFLLPHHPLDPRYRYCLEREHPPRAERRRRRPPRQGPWYRRLWQGFQATLTYAKLEYDYLVHGHEQIRLSRLVVLMDEDEELTIVIPEGMRHDWALEAVRGVIRSGLMRHRAHVGRNLLTAFFLQLILVIVVPTHVAGLLFLPLIGLYAVQRYREDRLIRRRMEHLLEVRLSQCSHRLQEHSALAAVEAVFREIPDPGKAYQEAIAVLDRQTGQEDGRFPAELVSVAEYYRDIGRWDPYERFQDRAVRSVIRALQRAKEEIVGLIQRCLRAVGLGRPRGKPPAGPVAPSSPVCPASAGSDMEQRR